MPNTLPVNNFVLDGACVRLRLGRIAVPVTEFEPPEETIKTEKVYHLGEQVATVRTLGIYEVKAATLGITSVAFARFIIPRVPAHAWNTYEFPITMTQKHPLVGGPYGVILDRCRFTGIKPEKVEASEKAIKMSLEVDPINVFHKGEDGQWKTLAARATEMSKLAQIAAQFLF